MFITLIRALSVSLPEPSTSHLLHEPVSHTCSVCNYLCVHVCVHVGVHTCMSVFEFMSVTAMLWRL